MNNIYEKKYIKYKKKYLKILSGAGAVEDTDQNISLFTNLKKYYETTYIALELNFEKTSNIFEKCQFLINNLKLSTYKDRFSSSSTFKLDEIKNDIVECIILYDILDFEGIPEVVIPEEVNSCYKIIFDLIQNFIVDFINFLLFTKNIKKINISDIIPAHIEKLNRYLLQSKKEEIINGNIILTNIKEKLSQLSPTLELLDQNIKIIAEIKSIIIENELVLHLVLHLLFNKHDIKQLFNYCDGNCFPEYQQLLLNLDIICQKSHEYDHDINLSSICNTFKKACINNLFINYDEKKCFVLSKLANQEVYYIHTYNPSNIEIPEDMKNHFNLNLRKHCCNCISIVLYNTISTIEIRRLEQLEKFTKLQDNTNELTDIYDYLNNNHEALHKYLTTMVCSLKIVSSHLKDFIIRYYLDSSIFTLISILLKETDLSKYKYLKSILSKLSYLINAPNSEIYILSCPSIPDYFKQNYRTYRFLPLFDETVNVFISREADGYVSISDCHNIKIFSKSNKMALFYNILMNTYNFDSDYKFNFSCYSNWLQLYILYTDMDNKINPYFDILAGCFGIKIQFNKEYLEQFLINLNINYNNIFKNLNYFNYNKTHIYYFTTVAYLSAQVAHNKNKLNTGITKLLHDGYDEIFLLKLFQPLNVIDNPDENKSIIEKEIDEKQQIITILTQNPLYTETLIKLDNTTTHIFKTFSDFFVVSDVRDFISKSKDRDDKYELNYYLTEEYYKKSYNGETMPNINIQQLNLQKFKDYNDDLKENILKQYDVSLTDDSYNLNSLFLLNFPITEELFNKIYKLD